MALLQSINEVYHWLGGIPDSNSGIILLKEAYHIGLVQSKSCHQNIPPSTNLSVRLSLPLSLTTVKTASWTSSVGGVPTSVADSLPPEDEFDMITAIISCLNHRLALNLCANPLLSRDQISRNISQESPDHMLLVGARHVRHMASYFDMSDISVSCVSVPSWRATTGKPGR